MTTWSMIVYEGMGKKALVIVNEPWAAIVYAIACRFGDAVADAVDVSGEGKRPGLYNEGSVVFMWYKD